MESLIDGEHGATALLAGLVIVLSLHLLVKMAEFVFDILKKKTELTQKNIDNLISALSMNSEALHRIDERMRSVENQLTEFSKFKTDIRKLYSVIKRLAGENWLDIKKSISEDEFL